MKINELSKSTHTNIETIRYYEKQGVLPPPKRLANGYRFYDEESIEQLNFIKKCRMLGFSLENIRELNHIRFSTKDHYQADQLVLNQLIQVENKISQLLEIKAFLQSIVTENEHNEEECKAIEGLKSECNL
ncbi:MerR family transcriptional regulator [Haemophilus quentini]|uniref:MerR family transcriptional regulator n=1 Tax=Haemophilus quentini TaxID=123834 RepID=A0ABX3BRL4_9PAST|nr:MerR family transcriptional regulator [Haemophilus quentini]EGT80354.1 HTH-type transcriptional regulator [Haemophilus haemolyticus M21639]OEY75281.1 MerR family transcriptional regulator [Haemophilus quentini]OEY75712.1 MerR family transcriptional regulator [Haemophilus quentini]ORC34202.1 MerR family transcriptional regulator [Haemophilus quentini]